jgi:type I restriction enzyme R subunit
VIETNIDRSDLENFLKVVYDLIKDTIYDDALVVQGKKGFVDATKAKITVILIKENLFKKIKDSYDEILEMLYVDLLLYKESI